MAYTHTKYRGGHIFFSFFRHNKLSVYSLEVPRWRTANEYQKHYFHGQKKKNKPGHSIYYKIACVPGNDSDQPAHMCSLNKVCIGQSLWQQRIQSISIFITKTYLYNSDPLKPHFYIVKLGFTGVYIIFLISAQKHRLWVLVRTVSMRRF